MRPDSKTTVLPHTPLPDTKAIRRYEEVERPTWLGKVRERLEHAHWLLSLEHNQIALAIQLENRGRVPAQGACWCACRRAQAMLCAPGVSKVPGPGLDELLLRLPAPPTPPKPRSSFLEDLSGLNLFHRTDGIPEPKMRRDPRALYWRSEHKGLRQDWEIECSEFQHQDVPKGVAFRLVIGPGAARHGNCAVECTVQAGNQPEPRTARLPVHIVWTEGDTIERIERMFSDPGSVKFDKEGHESDSLQTDARLKNSPLERLRAGTSVSRTRPTRFPHRTCRRPLRHGFRAVCRSKVRVLVRQPRPDEPLRQQAVRHNEMVCNAAALVQRYNIIFELSFEINNLNCTLSE